MARGSIAGKLAWLAFGFLAACSFDTSNVNPFGDGGVDDDGDLDPDAIAPSDCPEAIHVEVQVDGRSNPPPPGQPYLHRLVGDTVQLSAVGTCTQSGVILYTWTIEPGTTLIGATAQPDLNSETISVYSLQAENYTVRLRVGDGSGESVSTTIFAFQAHGFEALPAIPSKAVNDLSAGSDYLWIGGKESGYRADLIGPGPALDVDDLYTGDSVGPNISAVLESKDGAFAWLGTSDADGSAFRIDLGAGDISTLASIANSKTRDISDALLGVRYGTDLGVALAEDNQSFVLERNDAVEALSFGSVGSFGGKDKLYPLPDLTEVDVFGGNNKITGIAQFDDLVWVGGDGKGVASVLGNAVQEIFTVANSELSSDTIRSMTQDPNGDIWAATKDGVSRFKQDRQVWVPIRAGLSTMLDLKAITIDESAGRRAVYTGGKDGFAVMAIP